MSRARPKQIVLRMTEQELEAVKKKVEQSGMNQQDYLIKALTQKEIVSTEGMKALLPELKRIGNNLNQVARSCNEGNLATRAEVAAIGEELNEVWRLLRQLVHGHLLEGPSDM